MNGLIATRFLTLLISVLFLVLMSADLHKSITVSITWAHYVLGILYAYRPIGRFFRNPDFSVRSLILISAIIVSLMFNSRFNLILLTAMHFSLNDFYLMDLKFKISDSLLRRSRQLLFISNYLLGLALAELGTNAFIGLSILSVVALCGIVVSFNVNNDKISKSDKLKLLGYDLALLPLIGLSFFYTIEFKEMVFFHATFSWVFPYATNLFRENSQKITFMFLHTAGAAVAFVIPGLLIWEDKYLFDGGVVHVLLSLAISKSNPKFIRNFFATSS